MKAIVQATFALAVGHALAGAAYLGLINTPEANQPMLGLSLLLLVVGVVLALLTSLQAVRTLAAEAPPWRVGGALRLVPAAFVAVVVAGLLCWLAGAFEQWWLSHAGEVDATAIAVGDVTNTAWLHAAVRWIVAFVQWVLVPCWAAAGLTWAVAYGTRHVLSLKWLVAGLAPRLVLTALVAVALLVWLPWQAAYWRPAVQSTTLEMAVMGVKLGLLYLSAQLAWALVLDAAARRTRRA